MTYDLRSRIYALRVAVMLLSIGFGGNAHAQLMTADEFFHGGAQRFLTNNIPDALEVVTNGLQRFPNDEKLQKLYELLNQQQQQNQQNQNQDQQKDQQDKKNDQEPDQKSQPDKKDQQAKNDRQKKDEEKKKREEQQKKEQEKKEQQNKSAQQGQGKPEDKPGEAQPMEAHAMTPQEAKQLLDAQKDDEQVLIFQPKAEPKNPMKQLKDW